jgi:hypothetical protein
MDRVAGWALIAGALFLLACFAIEPWLTAYYVLALAAWIAAMKLLSRWWNEWG